MVIPDVYGMKPRKARKQHVCCECRGTIVVGETYHYHHGVWDGEGHSYKVCVDCDALRDQCDLGSHQDECTPFESLVESVDALYRHEPELLARFAAIKKMRGAVIPSWLLRKIGWEVVK